MPLEGSQHSPPSVMQQWRECRAFRSGHWTWGHLWSSCFSCWPCPGPGLAQSGCPPQPSSMPRAASWVPGAAARVLQAGKRPWPGQAQGVPRATSLLAVLWQLPWVLHLGILHGWGSPTAVASLLGSQVQAGPGAVGASWLLLGDLLLLLLLAAPSPATACSSWAGCPSRVV